MSPSGEAPRRRHRVGLDDRVEELPEPVGIPDLTHAEAVGQAGRHTARRADHERGVAHQLESVPPEVGRGPSRQEGEVPLGRIEGEQRSTASSTEV